MGHCIFALTSFFLWMRRVVSWNSAPRRFALTSTTDSRGSQGLLEKPYGFLRACQGFQGNHDQIAWIWLGTLKYWHAAWQGSLLNCAFCKECFAYCLHFHYVFGISYCTWLWGWMTFIGFYVCARGRLWFFGVGATCLGCYCLAVCQARVVNLMSCPHAFAVARVPKQPKVGFLNLWPLGVCQAAGLILIRHTRFFWCDTFSLCARRLLWKLGIDVWNPRC